MGSPFRRLLLATEHSEQDEGAEALAFALAARDGGALAAVMPLTSNPELESAAPEVAAKLDAEAARRREDLDACARRAGVVLSTTVRHGPEPYEEIVAAAREAAADLLVIRRRGRRGLLANLLVGEMVSKVVAHAPCSVLIAPRGACRWQRGVLVGVDPRASDPEALSRAAALAAEGRLPLTLVSVAESAATRTDAEQTLAAALLQARALHDRVAGEVRVGRAHQALIDAAREHGADLIVVARLGGAGLARAWIGGTTQKVIGLADCPVLVHIKSATDPTS